MSNMTPENHLRIRLPNGAEFEAKGSPDFIHQEYQEFLGRTHQDTTPPDASKNHAKTTKTPNISWDSIIERKNHQTIQLRAKLPGDRSQKDACLLLLAASQGVLHQPKPTATQLAKWLRTSGYPVLRMDRALQEGIANGELLSSGSRRARRYELTAQGKIKALLLAEQLTTHIGD